MGFSSHRRLAAHSASSSWHGTATIVEALLLLVFLLAAIALMTRTLSLSYAKADEGTQLSAAAMAASNTAERFAADPTDKDLAPQSRDGLIVTCTVTPEKTGAGTLYRAVVCVFGEDVSPAQALAAAKKASASAASGEGEGEGEGEGAASSGAASSGDAAPSDGAADPAPLYRLTTSRYVGEVS